MCPRYYTELLILEDIYQICKFTWTSCILSTYKISLKRLENRPNASMNTVPVTGSRLKWCISSTTTPKTLWRSSVLCWVRLCDVIGLGWAGACQTARLSSHFCFLPALDPSIRTTPDLSGQYLKHRGPKYTHVRDVSEPVQCHLCLGIRHKPRCFHRCNNGSGICTENACQVLPSHGPTVCMNGRDIMETQDINNKNLISKL